MALKFVANGASHSLQIETGAAHCDRDRSSSQACRSLAAAVLRDRLQHLVCEGGSPFGCRHHACDHLSKNINTNQGARDEIDAMHGCKELGMKSLTMQ